MIACVRCLGSSFSTYLSRWERPWPGKIPAWHLLLVDGTGLGFQDGYALSWRRGETQRQGRTPGRRVIRALVDERGWSFLRGAAVGPPYASEMRLLQEILDPLDALPPLPVAGDRGFGAVDLLEGLEPFGSQPALRMKGSWLYTLRHPLRQASQKKGERWGKYRYRVEGFFGLMKGKLGAAFPRVRQALAMRRALAVAVLYNLDCLVLFLRLFLGLSMTWVFVCISNFSNSSNIPEGVYSSSTVRISQEGTRCANA